MRVLFLDVDGVLNSHRTILTTGNCAHPHDYVECRHMFDWAAITMLQGLCRAGNLKVVLSSSWRYGMSQDDFERFGAFLGMPLIDLTPQAWPRHQRRGDEIKAWLDKHVEVTHYAIVDDDCDMLPEQKHQFVQTFVEDGLTWAPFLKLCDMFEVSPWDCAVPREHETAAGTPAQSDDQRQVREDSQGLGEPGRLSPDMVAAAPTRLMVRLPALPKDGPLGLIQYTGVDMRKYARQHEREVRAAISDMQKDGGTSNG